jgi:hypothetical protein
MSLAHITYPIELIISSLWQQLTRHGVDSN